MPSSSPAQARMMAGAAHSPAFARKVGVPQRVARDFNRADAGSSMMRHANARADALSRKRRSARRPAPRSAAPADGDGC